MSDDLARLQEVLGVHLRQPDLLRIALTHRSLVRERPLASYERLEFLGDSVVGVVVSEYLYHHLPAVSEGELAKRRAALVSKVSLAEAACRIELHTVESVRLVMDMLGERGKRSVLADTFEAVVGAVFLDRGYRVARRLVNAVLKPAYTRSCGTAASEDSKSALQQLTQSKWRELPSYETIREESADHQAVFRAVVSIHGEIQGTGIGESKKEAEQAAAACALRKRNREKE